MKYFRAFLRFFPKHPFFAYPLGIVFISLSIALGVISIQYNQLPTKVPLYYSLPWGKDRLADKIWLYVLPGAVFALSILNSIVSSALYKKQPFLAVLINCTSAFVALLSLYTLIRIVVLVV